MLISVGFFVWVKCIFVNMKRVLLSLIILSFFVSCKKSEQMPTFIAVPESVTDSLPNVVQDNQKDTLVNQKHSGVLVLNEVATFVGKMEQQGWVSDDKRLQKIQLYKQLLGDSVVSVANKNFYKIDYKNTWQKRGLGHVNCEAFQKAKSIIGYFYYNKNEQKLITDGIIEQWEFQTEEQAKEAVAVVETYGDRIYFNTFPYACYINNYVIIFQTRAMAFSHNQKEVFETFLKDNKQAKTN